MSKDPCSDHYSDAAWNTVPGSSLSGRAGVVLWLFGNGPAYLPVIGPPTKCPHRVNPRATAHSCKEFML